MFKKILFILLAFFVLISCSSPSSSISDYADDVVNNDPDDPIIEPDPDGVEIFESDLLGKWLHGSSGYMEIYPGYVWYIASWPEKELLYNCTYIIDWNNITVYDNNSADQITYTDAEIKEDYPASGDTTLRLFYNGNAVDYIKQ